MTPLPAQQASLLYHLQTRVFLLTWLSYASFYLTRKNLSVVKSRLHNDLGITTAALGGIDTLYLSGYAIGQFASGVLGDRLGPRRMLSFGMLASAASAVLFGLGTSTLIFALAFGCNGFFQSTGWPNNVKAMQPWFGRRSRGKVMGLWCTNYQVGGLCATALATYLLVTRGWRSAFFVPAALLGGVALLVALFLVERPAHRGLPPIDDEGGEAQRSPGTDAAAAPPRFVELLGLPAVWALGSAYFGLKLIRYSLLFWLPFYLREQLHYDERMAGYLSTSFEVGGIVGAVAIGWISDRHFAAQRVRLAAPVIFALAGALLLYQALAASGMVPNALAMALVGFLLFGPDTLISGAAAQDLGGSRATGAVAGLINGMGSVGAILQGVVTAFVTARFGWGALFHVFVMLALLSSLSLFLLARRGQKEGR